MTDTPAPMFSAPEAPVEAQEISVWSRMTNVLAAPSDAFEGIATMEKKSTLWLVPMIMSILVISAFAGMMMNNPAVQQKMRQAMAEKFDQSIREGKMTQDQADKAVEMTGGIAKYAGAFGSVIAVPLMWLLLALAYYAIVAFVLGGEITFSNVFVVIALTGVIGIIETLVTGFMQYATANMYAQPSLGMLVDHAESPMLFAALSRANPFTFWWLLVMGIGLSKVSNVPQSKTTLGVIGAWLVFAAAAVALSGLKIFGG